MRRPPLLSPRKRNGVVEEESHVECAKEESRQWLRVELGRFGMPEKLRRSSELDSSSFTRLHLMFLIHYKEGGRW